MKGTTMDDEPIAGVQVVTDDEPQFKQDSMQIGGWHDADLDQMLDQALTMHHGWVRSALILQVQQEAARRGDAAMTRRAEEALGPVEELP